MESEIEKRINSTLLNNRKILQQKFSLGKQSYTYFEIFGNGFDPDYFTSQHRHETTSQVYHFCYEYGLGKLPNGLYEIIKLPAK